MKRFDETKTETIGKKVGVLIFLIGSIVFLWSLKGC